MLMALIWWTILLHSKNKEVFLAQLELINSAPKDDSTTNTVATLTSSYKRQANMILGEGVVFGVSLLIGIWLIQRSFIRELETRERQNNFLLSITHELKSPLTAINLSLETLIKRKFDQETVNDIAGSALTESHRLEKLINDLLLASRLDHSYHFTMEKFDLSALTSETILRYNDKSESLHISSNIQEGIEIIGDSKALEKVITNLLENAIKYGDKNPIDVELSTSLQNSHALLKVKDKGPGIPVKERQKIFQKFYRIGSEHTRSSKGTGLGLYIIKKIIEGHQGVVSFQENKPKGSIFEVKLPTIV